MIFISFYTKGSYKEVANSHLIPTLEQWNLKYIVKEIDNLGNWSKNTGYKSQFILEMLEELKEDICWIDVDAKIFKYPELLFNIPQDYDLAYHNMDRFLQWGITGPHRYELASGTIMFRYNEKNIKLLKLWRKNVLENINTQEQLILQRIMTSPHDYKVFNLSVEYCAILLQDNTIPNYVKDPVILHFQASRRFRREQQ